MTDNHLVHPKNIADTKRAAEFCNVSEDEFMWCSENFVEGPKPIAEIGSGWLWDLAELSDFARNIELWKKAKVNFGFFLELLKKTSSRLPQDATKDDPGYAYTESELEVLRKASSGQSEETPKKERFSTDDIEIYELLMLFGAILAKNKGEIEWNGVYGAGMFGVHFNSDLVVSKLQMDLLQDLQTVWEIKNRERFPR